MKFELQQSEAKNLLRMVYFAESVVAYLHDHLDDTRIATKARVWGKLSDKLLREAKNQGMQEILDESEGRLFLNDQESSSIMELQDEFGDLYMYQELANKLARRDLFSYSKPEDLLKVAEENSGYLGVLLHPLEEKYWREFHEHDYMRLFISDEKRTDSTAKG